MKSRSFVFVLLFSFFVLPFVADAATLRLKPATGEYKVGDTVSVSVLVSSTDAINAASGILHFPTTKLKATTASKTGSIINYWSQEPNFSNTNGTVPFEGVVFNPGYTGTAGTIVTAQFKVIAAGDISLSISGGSVLANDGNGTEVLQSVTGSKLTAIAAAPIASSTKPTATSTIPAEATSTVIVLIKPTLDQYTFDFAANEILKISGKTVYPQVTVNLTLENDATHEKKIINTTSDNDGKFIGIFAEALPNGSYSVWAETVDDAGVHSPASNKALVVVHQTLTKKVLTFIQDNLVVISFSVVILILLIIILILTLKCLKYKKALLDIQKRGAKEAGLSANLNKKIVRPVVYGPTETIETSEK